MGKLFAAIAFLALGAVAVMLAITPTKPYDFTQAHLEREGRRVWSMVQEFDAGQARSLETPCGGDRYFNHHAEFSCHLFGNRGSRMLAVTIYTGTKVNSFHTGPGKTITFKDGERGWKIS